MSKEQTIFLQNRELSHLEFHKRILLKSGDQKIPFLERLRFLSIFQNNIDEFFMTRVALLYQNKKQNKKNNNINSCNPSTQKQIELICQKTKKLFKKADKLFFSLLSETQNTCFEYLQINNLETQKNKEVKKYYKYLEKIFYNCLFPFVSVQVIDQNHPFPFLKNKKSYIITKLFCKTKKESKKNFEMGIISIDDSFDDSFNNIIWLPNQDSENQDSENQDSKKFVFAQDLILFFADKLFSKHQVISKTVFKITRNSHFFSQPRNNNNQHNKNTKELISGLLKSKKNLFCVKLEINPCHDIKSISEYLRKKLNLEKKQVFETKIPLDSSFFSNIINNFDFHNFGNLFFPNFVPQKPKNFAKISMIEQVFHKDILLSFPYDSFAVFLKLLDQASQDNCVSSIKISLYRIAPHSQIISILKKAAENGKEVLAIVELKARFDEQNNINWATILEDSGCKVIYGLENLKIHSKILLITRKNQNTVKYISLVSTGNFNEATAKLYTDLSLITSDKQIGLDLLDLFNKISTNNLQETASTIISSPLIFKNKILNLIEEEICKAKAQKSAQIIIKCNSISDKEIICKLVKASQAGVKIQLIIRGICCLLPGIKKFTENIEVMSIIGRFLEHSRIFSFGVGSQKKIFISSADLMKRNTTNRIEVACPIKDPEIKLKISKLLQLYLKDNINSEKLLSSGKYQTFHTNCNYYYNKEKTINSQDPNSHYNL